MRKQNLTNTLWNKHGGHFFDYAMFMGASSPAARKPKICTIRLFLFLFFFSTKKFQGLSNRATTWVSKSSRESCPHPCKSRQYQGTSASTMRQALLSNKGSSAGARIATPRDPYRVPTAGLSHVARASTILHVARASVELMWFVPQRCACHSG